MLLIFTIKYIFIIKSHLEKSLIILDLIVNKSNIFYVAAEKLVWYNEYPILLIISDFTVSKSNHFYAYTKDLISCLLFLWTTQQIPCLGEKFI